MSIAQSLFDEYALQAPITRRFLERLPEDKLTWKPHAKSMTAGQLAFHLAVIPCGVVRAAQKSVVPPPDFAFPQPASIAEILKTHDESFQTVQELLPAMDDAFMGETWRIMAGDHLVLAQQRALFLRDVMLSHWYQHRGQFAVYLRLLEIEVPATWGPSADEMPASMQMQSA